MIKLQSAALALTCAMPAMAETELSVLNWSAYIDRSVLSDFTDETGISITYDTYNEGEATEARLLAGGSGYDLAVISSEYLGRLIEADAIKPFDHDALPGLSRLDPQIVDQVDQHDATGRYAVPYLWGTTGIGYDAAAIKARMPEAPVNSWRMIFDPDIVSRFADCGVAIIDAPEEVFATALHYLGYDPNSGDPTHIKHAEELIRSIAPFVQSFGTYQLEHLAGGEVCLALTWSGDALGAVDNQADGIDVQYSVPDEGAVIWFDLFVMPVDAAHTDAAHRFVEFQLLPQVIARTTNEVWYPNPNIEAFPYVDAGIRSNPAVYPPAERRERLFSVRARPADEKQNIARTWRMLQLGL